jgi:3-oxoacyl-[acyl-carrier protein] reductase
MKVRELLFCVRAWQNSAYAPARAARGIALPELAHPLAATVGILISRIALKVADRFGRLDILAVNAGILLGGTVDAFGLDDFDRMVATNIRGVFAAIHFAAPHIQDGGRIITIGSNTAIRTGFAGASVYSMTKAAVAVFVRGVAIDLAPRRITVNNVQPGPTATDMTVGHRDRVMPLIPLGRLGEPAEIAGLVAYLASEEAGFITGASYTIDGGYVA